MSIHLFTMTSLDTCKFVWIKFGFNFNDDSFEKNNGPHSNISERIVEHHVKFLVLTMDGNLT